MMKRMLALILSLMMLLSSTALAEGAALTVGNVKLNMLGETVTLSDLDMQAAYAVQGDVAGIDLSLLYQGESFADLVIAKDGDRLILTGDALSHAYALDLNVVTPILEQFIIDEDQVEDETDDESPISIDINLSEADMAALMTLWANWSKHLDTAITDQGTQTVDGATVQTIGFAFTAEMVDELVLGLCEILDNHPEIVAELTAESDAKSVAELYKAFGLALRTEGTLTLANTSMVLDADLYVATAEKPETRTHTTFSLAVGEEETGALTTGGVDLFVSTFDEKDALVDQIAAGLSLTADAKTSELYSMEGNLSLKAMDTQGELALTMLLYTPMAQEDGLWHLTIADKPETAALTAVWGEKDDKAVFDAALTESDGAKMTLSFAEKAENTGTFRFAMAAAEGEVSAEWDATLVDVDAAAWLPKAGAEALDLLTLTEEQMTELQTELSLLSANAVLGVMGTSEELMQMLSEMEVPADAELSE